MKKIIFILSLVLILVFSSVTAFAETTDEIIVTIDSIMVEFTEDTGLPFVDENYRTLVPFRKALETFGATVEWNNDSRIATAVKDDIKVEVPIDQNYIIVNGEQKANDTAAKIVDGRTYLPIRAVIEAFGSEVQWDQDFKTVVITTEPVDAKAILTLANNKSYEWKNYDAKINMNMSIPVKDDEGNATETNMKMNMYMTIFMEPSLKSKINTSLVMDVMGQEMVQPLMDMYLTVNDKSYTTYVGMIDESEVSWIKSTMEDELFANLFKYDEESKKTNQELTDKYTKDIKYFGEYTDESERSLLRLQYTISGDIYNEIFGTYIEKISTSTSEQDIMTAEMLKSFASGDFGDLTFIAYVDEATGEMVRYEMDLGNMIISMMSGMTEILGEIPAEEMEMLKQLKANMIMEILNINEAENFEIPEEALNALEMSEIMEELEELEELEDLEGSAESEDSTTTPTDL